MGRLSTHLLEVGSELPVPLAREGVYEVGVGVVGSEEGIQGLSAPRTREIWGDMSSPRTIEDIEDKRRPRSEESNKGHGARWTADSCGDMGR